MEQFFSSYKFFKSKRVVLPDPVGPHSMTFSNDRLLVSFRWMEMRNPLLNREAMSDSYPNEASNPCFLCRRSLRAKNASLKMLQDCTAIYTTAVRRKPRIDFML